MSLEQYDIHDHNPFEMKGVGERIISKAGQKMQTVFSDTGEVGPVVTIRENVAMPHDSRKYVKVFVDTWETVSSLPAAALQVYMYILFHLKVRKDVISLSQKEVCTWAKIGSASYYRGVGVLLKKDIIARKRGTFIEYWINTNYFYNGARV